MMMDRGFSYLRNVNQITYKSFPSPPVTYGSPGWLEVIACCSKYARSMAKKQFWYMEGENAVPERLAINPLSCML